jgi:hypothetical protein
MTKSEALRLVIVAAHNNVDEIEIAIAEGCREPDDELLAWLASVKEACELLRADP